MTHQIITLLELGSFTATYQHGETTVLDFGLAVVEKELTILGEEQRVESNVAWHGAVEQWILVEKGN